MGGLILILEQKLLFCSWAWALSVLELFLGLGFVWAWALPGLGLYLGLGFDRTWTLPRQIDVSKSFTQPLLWNPS